MNEHQLSLLHPVFIQGEKYTNGMPINWADVDYYTAVRLRALRLHLDKPVRLIWNVYHRNTNKTDATFPGLPLSQVFMGPTRLDCSWGIYSGNSIHLDTRVPDPDHHRWMAVRPSEIGMLKQRNLLELVTNMDDVEDGTAEWAYLSWTHPKAVEGLWLVLQIAEGMGAHG